jgi:hypothetical protein
MRPFSRTTVGRGQGVQRAGSTRNVASDRRHTRRPGVPAVSSQSEGASITDQPCAGAGMVEPFSIFLLTVAGEVHAMNAAPARTSLITRSRAITPPVGRRPLWIR